MINQIKKVKEKTINNLHILYEDIIQKYFSTFDDLYYKKLQEVTLKIGSGSTPRGGRAIYSITGIPFIRSLNVRMRKFQFDNLVYINEIIHQKMDNTKVIPKDVLINITGASIGRVAIMPDNINEANVNQHVSIIRANQNILIPEFLMYWLSCKQIQKQIYNNQKGATRKALTKAQLELLLIPIPPIAVQKQLIIDLDNVNKVISQIKIKNNKTLEKTEELVSNIYELTDVM